MIITIDTTVVYKTALWVLLGVIIGIAGSYVVRHVTVTERPACPTCPCDVPEEPKPKPKKPGDLGALARPHLLPHIFHPRPKPACLS
jgi:hypothetical protein